MKKIEIAFLGFLFGFLCLSHATQAQFIEPTYQLSLIDSETNEPIGTIADEAVIDKLVLGNIPYGFVLDIQENAPGSFKLELQGPRDHTQIENQAPFSLFGNQGDGIHGRILFPGDYVLKITAFSGKSLSGTQGQTQTFRFTVLPIRDIELKIVTFRIYNTDTQTLVAETKEDISLTLSEIGNGPIGIEAITEPRWVGSVAMEINGPIQFSRTENLLPYSLFADGQPDLFGRVFSSGEYMVCAQPYSETRLGGYAGEKSCLRINIVDDINCEEGSFARINNFGGGVNKNAIGFTLNGTGYVGCGEGPNGSPSNEFWKYDDVNDSWTQVASLPGSGREGPSAFVIDGKAYVGVGLGGTYLRDFWAYDPSTNAWSAIRSFPAGVQKERPFSFAYAGKGYVGGGARSGGGSERSVYAYDPQSDTWERKADFPTFSVATPAYFQIAEFGYVHGGSNIVTRSRSNDLWRYDFQNDRWDQMSSPPVAEGRGAHPGFAINGKGYIGMGLVTGRITTDFWEYNPTLDEWTFFGDFCGSVFRNPAAFVLGDIGYFGTGLGEGPGFLKTSSFWKFSPGATIGSDDGLDYSAYPNPVGNVDYLQIDLEKAGDYQVDLISSEGEILERYSFDVETNDKQAQIPLHQLKELKGLFFLRVSNASGSKTVRMMK